MATINPFERVSIIRALLIGFGVIWVVMALCVALAVARLEPVLDQIVIVNASRVPTANALGRLAGAVQESMSAANAFWSRSIPHSKSNAAAPCPDLDSQITVLEGLEPSWDEATRAAWKEALPLLKELGAAQDMTEMIVFDASSAKEGAALLKVSAAPKSARILDLLYGPRPEKGPREGGLLRLEQDGLSARPDRA